MSPFLVLELHPDINIIGIKNNIFFIFPPKNNFLIAHLTLWHIP